MDLNAILIFSKVVRMKSFSKAAEDLRITKSTVSKKVTELEASLNATLLRRTTRSLQLTDMGRQFYEQCGKALSELNEAAEAIQAASAEPSGRLRITAPVDFAGGTMASILASFMKRYPKVMLEMILIDRQLDLINENIDIAIRLGNLKDSNLRSRKLGRDICQLFGSPEYLKSKGAPREPGELQEHSCLMFMPEGRLPTWKLQSTTSSRATIEPNRRFVGNNVSIVKAMAVAGAGIAMLPTSNCKDELAMKKLKVVLPEWQMDEAPVHLVYQKHLFISPKVEAFLAHLEEHLKPLLSERLR